MPHLFFGADPEGQRIEPDSMDDQQSDKENLWGRTWKQMGGWLKKEEENTASVPAEESGHLNEKVAFQQPIPIRPSHNVIPGLPRAITFKRQDSERRERLYPVDTNQEERRALSVDRRLGSNHERRLSPSSQPLQASSLPKAATLDSMIAPETSVFGHHDFSSTAGTIDGHNSDRYANEHDVHSQLDWSHHDILQHPEHLAEALDDLQIQSELDAKWVLNLSMHFRDHSDREKFFITYAEEPTKWRRVTVSCDYRHAPAESLESDLKTLHYQRDKSARIYEAIRESLPQIQFYSTVTNLKLETSDGRLHVHVTEDVNEVIQYPDLNVVAHLELPHYLEHSIEYECHMSGFVYKVKAGHKTFIKKEIPGPEAVEEFLYEINALSSLQDSPNVVRIEGLVVDDCSRIKGVLLEYCEQGALVDIIYDLRHTERLSWPRRLKWARQIAGGLADIHEAGFVQGDFTLSNIVVDHNDDAQIIDINRRGCPIGWEPPELSKLIQRGQRIGMYIGVKSDLYQLGMVLWALAEQQDEPEREEQPLKLRNVEAVPSWYCKVVEACLSSIPRDRPPAKECLQHLLADTAAPPAMYLSPVPFDRGHCSPASICGKHDIAVTGLDLHNAVEYLASPGLGAAVINTNQVPPNLVSSSPKPLLQLPVGTDGIEVGLNLAKDTIDSHRPTPVDTPDQEKAIRIDIDPELPQDGDTTRDKDNVTISQSQVTDYSTTLEPPENTATSAADHTELDPASIPLPIADDIEFSILCEAQDTETALSQTRNNALGYAMAHHQNSGFNEPEFALPAETNVDLSGIEAPILDAGSGSNHDYAPTSACALNEFPFVQGLQPDASTGCCPALPEAQQFSNFPNVFHDNMLSESLPP